MFESGQEFDLLFSDVVMPNGMSGAGRLDQRHARAQYYDVGREDREKNGSPKPYLPP
jgi:hypothetical protein